MAIVTAEKPKHGEKESLSVEVADWVDQIEWVNASATMRGAYLNHCADLLTLRKRSQIGRGIGADARPLKPVKPSSRPDGATGPPLQPHDEKSRSQKWLRASKGKRHVTLWWSHGWSYILGAHARGVVRYCPVRDIVGMPAKELSKVKVAAKKWWKAHTWPGGIPDRVELILAGKKPKVISGRIQVGGMPEKPLKKPKPPRKPKLPKPKPPPPPPPPPEKPSREIMAAKQMKAIMARLRAEIAEAMAEENRLLAEYQKVKNDPTASTAAYNAWNAAVGRVGRARRELQRAEDRPGTFAPVATTRAELSSRVGVITTKDPFDPHVGPKAAIADFIRENQSPETSPVQKQGMRIPEEMHSLEFDGITYRYPPLGTSSRSNNDPIVMTLKDYITRDFELPRSLTKHTQEVILSSGDNKDDDYWRARYKNFSGATATGGDGDVVAYKGYHLGTNTLVHEMGHNLAKGRFGDTTPPPDSAFGKAIASGEPVPTEYGKNSDAEDFAESTLMYVRENENAYLKKIAPKRHEAIRDMLEEEP